MGIEAELIGTDSLSRRIAVDMHCKHDVRPGAIVYTEPYRTQSNQFFFFASSDAGSEMAIDASFGGTPDIIHIGISDGVKWTGSNVVGAKADFDNSTVFNSGSVSVEIDNPALNDIWQFAKGSDLVVTGYTALTMFVYVDKDWSNGDSVELTAYDTGGAAVVGSSVLLENYIDEFTFDVWQKVTIPFTDLGLSVTNFDAIRMELVGKNGGKAPKFYIDDFQVEQTGTPVEFVITPNPETVFFVTEILFFFKDAVATTLADNSMAGLDYTSILGATGLTSGFTLRRTSGGIVDFAIGVTTLGDLLDFGSEILNVVSLNTKTHLGVVNKFTRPIIIDSQSKDTASITITDDFTNLTSFTAMVRGWEEPV